MPNRYITDTVRLQILRYLLQLFEKVTVDTYGLKFSKVELGPLVESDNSKHFSLGIVAPLERKNEEFPIKNVVMDVDLQFRITVNKGDELPTIMGERVLGVVQQVMLDDEDLGGLIIIMTENGSEIDVNSYGDRSVFGVTKFQLTYRQQFQNVYITTPSV